MKVHEYQAKAVLKRFGVPVPNGESAQTPGEAQAIATKLGTKKVVVKSQIHAGGRGKGKFVGTATGGVIVTDAAEAGAVAGKMLGNVLVTKQSGPEGRKVGRVLVEEGMEIVKEYYLALLLDRAVQAPVFIASAEGGTEIEEVAEARPERDPSADRQPHHGLPAVDGAQARLRAGGEPRARRLVREALRRVSTPRFWAATHRWSRSTRSC